MALALAGAGLGGVLIGSFANVVVHRIPAGMSIVTPPSGCPACATPILRRDNVPVVSFLLLRGRCRSCRERISIRYPLVEAGMGLFFVVVTLHWMLTQPSGGSGLEVMSSVAVLVAFLYLAAASVVLAAIDVNTHRLPSAIVLPLLWVGLVLLGGAALLDGDVSSFFTAVLGGAALLAVYGTLRLIRPGGMGLGDVKLAGVLGFYLGWWGWGPLLVGAFAAFVLGGVFGMVLVVSRRVSRHSGVPFGPWMLGGAWVGIIFGTGIFASYLSLFSLAP